MRRDGSLQELRSNWGAMLGAALGVSVGVVGILSPTNGLFFKQLGSEYGWSIKALSALAFTFGIAGGLSAPLMGALVDKFGVRSVAAVGFAYFTLALFGMSFMHASFAIYAAWMLSVAVVGTACSSIVFARVVSGAFDKARGFSLGLLAAGTGVSGMILPPLVATVITEDGWRDAYRLLAGIVLVSAPLVIWLIGRRGDPAKLDITAPTELGSAEPAGFAVLLRDRKMLYLMAATVLMTLGLNGFVIHTVPLLIGKGFSLLNAAYAQSVFFFALLIGRIGLGIAMDRFFAPWVCAATLLLAASGMAMLLFGGLPFAYLAVFTWGIAYGAETDYLAFVASRYFGLTAFGRAYGLLYGTAIVSTGLSPVLIAYVSGNGKNYDNALLVADGLILASVVLLLFAPRFSSTPDSETVSRPRRSVVGR